MRRQAVLAGEAARAQILDREKELERMQRELERAWASHRERGGEIERLQALERELEASHRERGGEIERLHSRENYLEAEIEAIKATRVWRLHERLRSLRGSGD